MKYLIVNADDFGASPGVNRGVLQAHRQGILTSASLLVRTPWSADAAALSRAAPRLSVGLHADLEPINSGLLKDPGRDLRAELRGQVTRFRELMGRLPSHLDSHHNAHRNPELVSFFLELAEEYGLPLREHSSVVYFSKFYGQWDGETHLEQISAENLVRMLELEIGAGITELSCHPGYVDSDLNSSYAVEREAELRTLCNPLLTQALQAQQIQLTNYVELGRIRRIILLEHAHSRHFAV